MTLVAAPAAARRGGPSIEASVARRRSHVPEPRRDAIRAAGACRQGRAAARGDEDDDGARRVKGRSRGPRQPHRAQRGAFGGRQGGASPAPFASTPSRRDAPPPRRSRRTTSTGKASRRPRRTASRSRRRRTTRVARRPRSARAWTPRPRRRRPSRRRSAWASSRSSSSRSRRRWAC